MSSESLPSPVRDDFYFPIPHVLENERVKLVPFIPSDHAQQLIENTTNTTWSYMPFGPYKTAAEFIDGLWKGYFQNDPSAFLFAVYDKTRSRSDSLDEHPMAGVVGYVHTSPMDLMTEIGPVIVFPAYHHTHIASNMIGLLLHYALDLPESDSDSEDGLRRGGLGLRRVQWGANVKNVASVGLAMKMGLKKEAVFRWAKVLSPEKEVGGNGVIVRGKSDSELPGRDSVLLAICWDDWESGGREKVDLVMNRK